MEVEIVGSMRVEVGRKEAGKMGRLREIRRLEDRGFNEGASTRRESH